MLTYLVSSLSFYSTISTMSSHTHFDLITTIKELHHYLPAQAPLKDFIHHNTLHAFQHLKFEKAVRNASAILGYKGTLTLQEYRTLYAQGRIRPEMIDLVIKRNRPDSDLTTWRDGLLTGEFAGDKLPRIGSVRSFWKKGFHIDLDSLVHPTLFRILCSYLDQGISMWNFPNTHHGLVNSIREMEKITRFSFFRSKKARALFMDEKVTATELLHLLVGDENYFEHYLFDQQFAHQGWSGMVATIEQFPATLLDRREITLEDLIILELVMEIDALEAYFGPNWSPLAHKITDVNPHLFEDVSYNELHEVLELWQAAFEWTLYDDVLAGIQLKGKSADVHKEPASFQALFCIDDRECSLRRYIETEDPRAATYGTPGFFGVEFFFKPMDGKFVTKLCPAPVTPKYLIKEVGNGRRNKIDVHLQKNTHGLFRGWLITQTLGFSSAFRLFLNIFRPSAGPATASSFRHMDQHASLTVLNPDISLKEDGLQIGFTIDEMVVRVENHLRSIGLVKDFAPLVYVIGHGSSSVNNPHFAAYDCGACSGRAGSVNARVFSNMANNSMVREQLAQRGITIPETTWFISGLHDTTMDEILFYDVNLLSFENRDLHQKNESVFKKALDNNAKERSRRFISINTRKKASWIHEKIRIRSVTLFEPRPELNHATNALCIVGRRDLTRHLFLDRRSFMNSYDYSIDPKGISLAGILRAAAPVCGGINLEYFFSRVDNMKLGAGTKLPHNVMGLIGVANGMEGDLRPGLPSQMIEMHDPVRLMIIVEQFADVVLDTIKRSAETYEWFANNWVNLVTVNPETLELHYFTEGVFLPYTPVNRNLPVAENISSLVESTNENIPVHILK